MTLVRKLRVHPCSKSLLEVESKECFQYLRQQCTCVCVCVGGGDAARPGGVETQNSGGAFAEAKRCGGKCLRGFVVRLCVCVGGCLCVCVCVCAANARQKDVRQAGWVGEGLMGWSVLQIAVAFRHRVGW